MLPGRQGSDTSDHLTIMASSILRALRSLGRCAAGLGAQGLIVLIAVGTPIAGLCLLAYISPVIVRTVLGERSVILACLLWLALSTFSAVYLYNAHVLPLTLRLGERIKAWHEGLKLQDTAPAVAGVLPHAQQAVFGLVIILFLIFEPQGLAKLWRNVKDYFHVWPFGYRS